MKKHILISLVALFSLCGQALAVVAFDVNVQVQQPICHSTNGLATVSIVGGLAPYEYQLNSSGQWVSIDNGGQISLPDGPYSIIFRDANLLQAPEVIGEVLVPTAPVLTYGNYTLGYCYGEPNIASFTISGGTPPYSVYFDGLYGFNMSNIYENQIQTVVYNSSMVFPIITDSLGCNGLFLVPLPIGVDHQPIVVSGEFTNPSTSSGKGSVQVHISGTPNDAFYYDINNSYDWIYIEDGQTITDLPAGDYTINIRNQNYCLASNLIVGTISIPTELQSVNEYSLVGIEGAISVKNAVGLSVEVLDLQGNSLIKQNMSSNEESILLASGIYIVSINGKTEKVIVK